MGIPPHVIILSVIKEFRDGQEALRYDGDSKMIDCLDSRGSLFGFFHNQMREFFIRSFET